MIDRERANAVGSGSDRRVRMVRLDNCLRLLEEAHERNETVVSRDLSSQLRSMVQGVATGLAITEAIELVFEEQERCLERGRHSRGAQPRSSEMPAAPEQAEDHQLDEASARALTEEIKRAVCHISLLLLEAHERRAWVALGYGSWEVYVRREFDLSRSRSYELLDHGRLVRGIQDATGLSAIADISVYTARRLKPRLAQVIAAIQRKVAGVAEQQRAAVVAQVIEEHRQYVESKSTQALVSNLIPLKPLQHRSEQIDAAMLGAAIDYLATMPDPSLVVDRVKEAEQYLQGVERALWWLGEFVNEWTAYRSGRIPGR